MAAVGAATLTHCVDAWLDDSRTMCGRDVDEHTTVDPNTRPTCVVCLELARTAVNERPLCVHPLLEWVA